MNQLLEQACKYAGLQGDARREMVPVLEKVRQELPVRWVWHKWALERVPAGFRLTGTSIVLSGGLAGRMMADCSACIVLCATLGMASQQALSRLQLQDMKQALLWSSACSAWIESFLDERQQELAEKFSPLHLTDRFSCGYGDLSLDVQKDILQVLSAGRCLGVHLVSSGMMVPEKSVTAFIGLSDHPQPARIRGCAGCSLNHCEYKERGTVCHE